MEQKFKKICVNCGKEKFVGLRAFTIGSDRCYSCANRDKSKLGGVGTFIRNCSVCDIDVKFFSKRAFSIAAKSTCLCSTCRNRRYSRICPNCTKILYSGSVGIFKREGKNCKSCESLLRITEKKGYGFCGIFKNLHFRSTLELSFMLENANEILESGEQTKWGIIYSFMQKEHIYYPDFIIGDTVYEIKPRYAQTGLLFNSKKCAAEIFCKNKNMKFIVVDPPSISKEKLYALHTDKIITLTSKTLKTILTKI